LYKENEWKIPDANTTRNKTRTQGNNTETLVIEFSNYRVVSMKIIYNDDNNKIIMTTIVTIKYLKF